MACPNGDISVAFEATMLSSIISKCTCKSFFFVLINMRLIRVHFYDLVLLSVNMNILMNATMYREKTDKIRIIPTHNMVDTNGQGSS
jgi:hypothetical protein